MRVWLDCEHWRWNQRPSGRNRKPRGTNNPLSFTRKMLVTIFAKSCVRTIVVRCRHFVFEPLHSEANLVTQMTNLLLLEVEARRHSETGHFLSQRFISFHGGLRVRRSRLAERHPRRRGLGKYTHDKVVRSILKDCEMTFEQSCYLLPKPSQCHLRERCWLCWSALGLAVNWFYATAMQNSLAHVQTEAKSVVT